MSAAGFSLVAAGFAPNLIVLAIALFALGMFAAIYHPVGTAMLIEQATTRGRSLAFNGVCGNLGAALAAGITARAGRRVGLARGLLGAGRGLHRDRASSICTSFRSKSGKRQAAPR